MMRQFLFVLLVFAWATPANAQQPVTVTLTAAEVHALRVTFGADANVQAKMEAWVHDWCMQFTRNVREREQRELREALVKLTPEQEAAVRKLLVVSTPTPVTAEERAVKVKTEQEARSAEQTKQAAERAKAQAEKDAIRAEAEKARVDKIASLLVACKAVTPKVDCSFIK